MDASNKVCQEHNKEKVMFCESEKIWICDLCMKHHKKCGFPIHYTEVLDNYFGSELKNQQSNQKTPVQLLDIISKMKSDINELIGDYEKQLNDSLKFAPNMESENKLELAMQCLEMKENKLNHESFQHFYQAVLKSVENTKKKCDEFFGSQLEGDLIEGESLELLKSWIGKPNLKLKLLYKATQDGFEMSNFHKKC